MIVSARATADVLRDRLPGLATEKLHKLLYYCQGHHLAAMDEPLFGEAISAWDTGPVVGELWHQESDGTVPPVVGLGLDEARLNTIGYVLSRYGSLTGRDLEHLTRGESPWRMADRERQPGGSARIRTEWMRDYFRTSGAADGDEDGALLDSTSVTQWLKGAESRRADPVRPDSPEELRARLSRRA